MQVCCSIIWNVNFKSQVTWSKYFRSKGFDWTNINTSENTNDMVKVFQVL